MALIVEDGTGLPNADSYVSLVESSAYHTAMGNSAWGAASPSDQESALRRSTQYLDTRYSWKGNRLTDTQALAWPRTSSAWPVKAVKTSCCELALRALSGSLYTDRPDAAVKRETVGPITVEYGHSQQGGQVRYVIVDDLLSGLINTSGRLSLRVERAS